MRWFLSCYRAGGKAVSINQLESLNSPASRALVDASLGIDSTDLSATELQPLRVEALRRFVQAQAEAVYFKVHETYTQPGSEVALLPAGVENRVVRVVRDPRDVALSCAEFAGVAVDTAIDWLCHSGQMLPEYTKGVTYDVPVRIGSWSDHLSSWDQAPNSLLIRYEDMHENPLQSFTAVLLHLGVAVDAERLQRSIDSSGFDRAATEERNDGFVEAMPGRRFFGHGAAGRWRGALSPAQARRIETHHAHWMRQLNYQ